jgi:hypothetical protein
LFRPARDWWLKAAANKDEEAEDGCQRTPHDHTRLGRSDAPFNGKAMLLSAIEPART